MQVIDDSAEYHFLTLLDKLKSKAASWHYMHFQLGRRYAPEQYLNDLSGIRGLLSKNKDQSNLFLAKAKETLGGDESAYLYQFSDGDILVFTSSDRDSNQIYQTLSGSMPDNIRTQGVLDQDYMDLSRLADRKILSAKRMQAYHELSDTHKIKSIPTRRNRREDSLIMVLEDDRFTAAYASNILNKVYDLIHVRTGEDAILQYIEQAPDVILLDIHLPGLAGTQVLQAITQIDPQSYAVMLSVDASHDQIKAVSKYGGQTFLKKPFSKDRLINTVRKSPHIRLRENRTLETVKV